MEQQMSSVEPAAVWKRGLATVLDLITVFFGAGYLIGVATGQTTSNGFNLHGGPALLLFAVMVAYFVVGRRYAGGTLWDRILGIRRPQPRA
jgi:hypothetical protein